MSWDPTSGNYVYLRYEAVSSEPDMRMLRINDRHLSTMLCLSQHPKRHSHDRDLWSNRPTISWETIGQAR